MLELFNATVALTLSVAAGWAAMSPRVRVNLLIHVGLIFIALGFFSTFLLVFDTFTYISAVIAANAIVHIGLLLCAVGYYRLTKRTGAPCRRISDWMSLDDPSERRHHSRHVTDLGS